MQVEYNTAVTAYVDKGEVLHALWTLVKLAVENKNESLFNDTDVRQLEWCVKQVRLLRESKEDIVEKPT